MKLIFCLNLDLTSPLETMSQSSLSVPPSTQRSISMESSGSSYMDCKSTVSSESEEEDMDYYYKVYRFISALNDTCSHAFFTQNRLALLR